ncbi:MAG: D-alanine--D-alanine ligase [Caldilineaceae bacterium]|nr:D-alanine--D-alanine ligase [Caldilineaceae bacterium]
MSRLAKSAPLRIGVLFGGRSSEHDVSLASAANVIDALRQAGHQVMTIGITAQGRWLANENALAQLTAHSRILSTSEQAGANGRNGADASDQNHFEAGLTDDHRSWKLLPQTTQNERLPEIDVVFPVLHGPYGEDGTVQGMLEMANVPYVGCGVASSALAMDKALAKQLFAAAGLPQTPWKVVQRAAWKGTPERVIAELEQGLAYPLFVKPANLGSSVGISKAESRSELGQALELAARFDRKLIVEHAVANAREIEVAVLGNDQPEASVPGEIVPGNEFYDYAAKYLDDSSALLIPAPLEAGQSAAIQKMALDAFRAIDGSGLARVDFLLDDESGELFLNEINTLPGFTRISMFPKLWEASGVGYPELVDRLVQLALERFGDRQSNVTTREH